MIVALSVLRGVVILVFVAVVGYATVIVQRKLGPKWLWVVWLAPTAMLTGLLLTQIDYTVVDLLSRPVLRAAIGIFVPISFLSGMVVWHAAVRLGPRPSPIFVSHMPMGLVAGAHGLTGILGCYHKLLATYATALDTVPRHLHPYPSVSRAFLITLRSGLPSSMRAAAERARQRATVPSILGFDLVGAEAVLAELEMLTPAQLSAIEACHQLNVRRLHQRSIMSWGWRGKLAGLVAAIVALGSGAEYLGVLKLKDVDLWPLISGISMYGSDIPSTTVRTVLGV